MFCQILAFIIFQFVVSPRNLIYLDIITRANHVIVFLKKTLTEWLNGYTNVLCIYIFLFPCNLIFLKHPSRPVSWGCIIHRLHHCRGLAPAPNKCPRYDTKQHEGEVPMMLELLRMRSTSSLPSLPGPLRALSIGKIELNCVLMLNWIVWNRTVFDIETVLTLNWIVKKTSWHLTVCKQNLYWY